MGNSPMGRLSPQVIAIPINCWKLTSASRRARAALERLAIPSCGPFHIGSRPEVINGVRVFEQGPELRCLMLVVYVVNIRGPLVQPLAATVSSDARQNNQVLVIRENVVNIDAQGAPCLLRKSTE